MKKRNIRLSIFLMLIFTILISTKSFAIKKTRLVNVFAYVKQASIFCQKLERPGHSIYSHSGWAKHKSKRIIVRAIIKHLFDLSLNYSRLQKKRLIKVFAYLKQAKLYLKNLDAANHSIYSHSGWARTQKWRRIKKAIKVNLKLIGFDIIKMI